MLETITSTILQTTPTESIFLLAIKSTDHCTTSIFSNQEINSKHSSHYHLLVIVPNSEARSVNELQDIMEGRCSKIAPVTIIAMSLKDFNNRLAAGNAFAVKVFTKANVLYDAGNNSMATPGEKGNNLNTDSEIHDYFHRAEEFFAGAELYIIRREYPMATFFLHQATELTLSGLILYSIGYRPVTHHLGRLISLCELFSTKLAEILLNHQAEEDQFFKLLQKAYIHSRYRNDYHISKNEISIIKNRVQKLLEQTSHTTVQYHPGRDEARMKQGSGRDEVVK